MHPPEAHPEARTTWEPGVMQLVIGLGTSIVAERYGSVTEA
jgi:hypothetical protein